MPNADQQGQAALDSFLDMWVTGTTGGRRAPVLRASMTTFLLSVCLDADSTCVAMATHPEEFEHIKSRVAHPAASGVSQLHHRGSSSRPTTSLMATTDSTKRSLNGPAFTSLSNRRSSMQSRSISPRSSPRFMTTR